MGAFDGVDGVVPFGPTPMNVAVHIEEGIQQNPETGETHMVKFVKLICRSSTGEAHYYFDGNLAEWLGQQLHMRGREAKSPLLIAQEIPKNGKKRT